MHGDVESPDDAVLTKSDYDEYPYKPRGRAFLAALEVAVTSRSFLFLGFSFNDPNVERVLSGLSAMQDVAANALLHHEASATDQSTAPTSALLMNIGSRSSASAIGASVSPSKRYSLTTTKMFRN